MTWQTVVVHVTIALAAIGAVCALAVEGVISGSDAFTVIVAVLVGAGVIAGTAIGSGTPTPGTTTTTVTPTAVTTRAGQ